MIARDAKGTPIGRLNENATTTVLIIREQILFMNMFIIPVV